MSTKTEALHTQEPWSIGGEYPHQIFGHDGFEIAHSLDLAESKDNGDSITRGDAEVDANARRIAACVNACQGIDTEGLEAHTPLLLGMQLMNKELSLLENQRAQLLAALGLMLECIPEPPDANCSCHLSPPCEDCVDYGGARYAFEFARDAIATVKGDVA